MPSRRSPLVPLLLAALVSALLVAACGGDDDAGGGGGSGATSAGTAAATSSPAATASIRDTSTKPVLDPLPTGPPPRTLDETDIVRGTGRQAKQGDTVVMQYVGWGYANGKQFDASWDRGEPFTFTLGAGDVIKGWDKGIVGMRVGGRRKLVIPPDLGYGEAGAGPDIGPGETLIFIVDLQAIK
jgi:peptidylprolyl isomerase